MSRHIVIDGVKQEALLWDLCDHFAVLIYDVETDQGMESFEERGSLLALAKKAAAYNQIPQYRDMLLLDHHAFIQFLEYWEQKQDTDSILNQMIENDPALAELAELI